MATPTVPVETAPGPLRVPAFRRLWIAGLVSELGDWLLLIALPLVVLDLTGSALVTATVFVLGLAPSLLIGPLAGVIADRVDRRRLLVWVSLAQAVLLLPLLAVHDRHQLWLVYLVTVSEAALAAVFQPAQGALLPALVGPAQVLPANALVGLSENLARLVGSPLGGVVLAVTGLRGVVLGDALSFLVVAALVAGRCGRSGPIRRRSGGSGWPVW